MINNKLEREKCYILSNIIKLVTQSITRPISSDSDNAMALFLLALTPGITNKEKSTHSMCCQIMHYYVTVINIQHILYITITVRLSTEKQDVSINI